MGNEGSQLRGLEIDERATEVTEFWSHYQATVKDSCRYFSLKSDGSVSVFKGELVLGPLWAVLSPLEKYSNNLLKYRHPCIVRYLTGWKQRSTFNLATEYVQPLSQVLNTLTPLQICIGLNNILRALVFLHDQANMAHINVSISAIYVTDDGQWKLGGLQYLCSFKELTTAYLKHARLHRYDKAVDPNEDSYENITKVDQYAFATLVEDIFHGKSCEDVPHFTEFKEYCKMYLQHQNPLSRPKLADVLKHNFFNHDFISIYKFLYFIPLKSDEEKSEFFSNILERLKCYDEETIAKQLGGLLLSRLTMLDQTARRDVIPNILKPKNERQNGDSSGVLKIDIFKEHIKPRLMQLFSVRDKQIRMVLLSHFSKYVQVFTHDELSQHILPELLLGIKDTDDNLVSSTLICLSELVPILGADTVIGNKRSKIFNDGRPNNVNKLQIEKDLRNLNKTQNDKSFLETNTLENFINADNSFNTSSTSIDFDKTLLLNERPSPVGGESIPEETLTTEYLNKANMDDWSDWDNQDSLQNFIEKNGDVEDSSRIEDLNIVISESIVKNNTKILSKTIPSQKNLIDITELDIKNQKADMKSEEFDYFADMTPVIEKPTLVIIPSLVEPSKLDFVPLEGADEDWGENWDE